MYFIITTITVTVTDLKPTCIFLEAHEPKTIKSLINKIQCSELLSVSSRKKLEEIALGYRALSDPTPRQKSILLHQLIYEVIYPSTKEELEDEQIDSLFEFEDQAKTLLKQILPEGMDIQDYLNQLSIEKVVIERLILFKDFYQSQLDYLDQSAESLNSKMIAEFNEIKSRFVKFSVDTEGLDKKLKDKIDELAKKMRCLEERYEEAADKALGVTEKFNDLQKKIMKDSRTFTP